MIGLRHPKRRLRDKAPAQLLAKACQLQSTFTSLATSANNPTSERRRSRNPPYGSSDNVLNAGQASPLHVSRRCPDCVDNRRCCSSCGAYSFTFSGSLPTDVRRVEPWVICVSCIQVLMPWCEVATIQHFQSEPCRGVRQSRSAREEFLISWLNAHPLYVCHWPKVA